MRYVLAVLLLSGLLYAQCPLGFTPEEACSEVAPSCGLYVDSDGDGYCDNPGPRTQPPNDEVEDSEEHFSEQIVTPADTISAEPEDTLCVEQAVLPGDSEPYTEEQSTVTEPPQDTSQSGSLTDSTVEESEVLVFYPSEPPVDEEDNVDTVLTSAGPAAKDFSVVVGCPLAIPPEAACPDSLALCPHWYGVSPNTTCSNPAGGQRRMDIVLIALAVLLPVSTWLSRKFYGNRVKDRLRRNTAHHVIRGVSLMILGFGVQGCFCPLGTFQYAFSSLGLAFLGLAGVLVFLLPLVFSAFFGRVYCGWVCPFGALQEFLYSVHIPGRFSPSGKIHNKMKHLNKLALVLVVGAILLNRFGVISLRWVVPFCEIDPFHTIFTLFLSGSLVVAGVMIIMSMLVRRFFCRYFCFYGAALSLLAKLSLWNKLKGIRREVPEIDSDEEFDR